MVVGLCPSTRRPPERRLEPFGASAFALIELIRNRLGSVYVTNLVKVPKDPGQKVLLAEVREWFPTLERELELVQPRKVLVFGADVARALCPGFVDLREDHGTVFKRETYYVIPTYHPAAVIRDPRLRPVFRRDLERFYNLDPDQVNAADYEILEPAELLERVAQIQQGTTVFLDLETTGLDELRDMITQLGLGYDDSIWIVQNPDTETLNSLGNVLLEKDVTLVGHNLAFDLKFLTRRWLSLRLQDTMLLAHLSGEESLSLKSLVSSLTDLPGSRFGGGYEDPTYLAEDVRGTREIYRIFDARVGDVFARTLVHRILRHLVVAYRYGVYVDHSVLNEVITDYEARIQKQTELLNQMVDHDQPINWFSNVQVSRLLSARGLPLDQTPTGAPSVSESSLLPLAEKEPLVHELLVLRGLKKISEFARSYIELSQQSGDGLLHPRMMLTGTATGRLSCRDPNLQQVPRVGPLKRAFRPRNPDGLIALVDLKQAELRIAALISGDTKLAEMLISGDPHRQIASILFEKPADEVSERERKSAKAIVFGLLYGGSTGGLSERTGFSESHVVEVLRIFSREFSQLSKWISRQKQPSPVITTLFGRKRDLSPLINVGDYSSAFRRAINTPIQSLASDVMLAVLATALDGIKRHDPVHFLFGVHDSAIFELDSEIGIELLESRLSEGFRSLDETPISSCSLWPRLKILGDLKVGKSWAAVEETNEAYDPIVEKELGK